MKRVIFILFYLTLFSFVKADNADTTFFVRPLKFDNANQAEILIQEGKKTIFAKDAKGNEYLLVEKTLMQTIAATNADLLLDNVQLLTDKRKLSNASDRIVFSKNKQPDLYKQHKPLAATLTYRKTEKKYYQNSVGLPAEYKDIILESNDTLFLHVEADNSFVFYVVINEKTLIVDTSFVTNKDIIVSPSRLGLDSLSLSSIHENKNDFPVSIRIHPEDHLPSYIKNIKFEYNLEEVPYQDTIKNEELPWKYILAGVILASIIVGLVLFILQRRKKRKEEEPLDFTPKDSKEGKDHPKEKLPPEVIIQNLKNEIERMARDLSQERRSSLFFKGQAEKISSDYKLLEMSVQSQIEKATSSLRGNLESVKKELKNLKDETKQKIEEARSDEKEKQKQKIDDLTNKVKTLNENLDQEKKDKKKQVEDARKEEKEKSEKTISELNTKLDTLRDNLAEKQNSLRETELALNQMTAAFDRDEQTISILNEAQRQYTERITFVDFAHQYASNVQRLLDIVAKINVSASKLIEANVPDPYLIYKAISRFSIAQSEISFEDLATEVNMAASCKMTFSNNGIANLSGVAPAEQINSLRNYFLAAYLEKYINAVMVYNESLAGIDRLVKGLTPQLTAPFVQYREELKACFKQLGIAVISVKLFDSLGDNMDLKAKIIDYDDSLPSESIIEIQNCLVYPEGGRRPNDKIFVTAQR